MVNHRTGPGSVGRPISPAVRVNQINGLSRSATRSGKRGWCVVVVVVVYGGGEGGGGAVGDRFVEAEMTRSEEGFAM